MSRAADYVEEQAREHAGRADVEQEEAEAIVVWAGVVADALRAGEHLGASGSRPGGPPEYHWSECEDEWPSGQGPFATREEAALDAERALGSEGHFCTCLARRYRGEDFALAVPHWLVTDALAEFADELGTTGGWPTQDEKATAWLAERLVALVREYVDEHDPPGFWTATEVQWHPAGKEVRGDA